MAPVHSRLSLSAAQKIDILDFLQLKTKSRTEIIQEYEIGKSTITRIVQDEAKIRGVALSNGNLNQKRKRVSYKDVNAALSQWFHQQRAKNAIITGHVIMEKAKQLSVSLGVKFEPNSGWLQRWKGNENISFQSIQGGKVSSDETGAAAWIENVLPGLVNGYDQRNIYDTNETGLFFKALPTGTFAVRGEHPSGEKVQKERLTALFLCNQDGSDKQVFVIGKSKDPRCFHILPRFHHHRHQLIDPLAKPRCHIFTIPNRAC